jgi:hypothetical protein
MRGNSVADKCNTLQGSCISLSQSSNKKLAEPLTRTFMFTVDGNIITRFCRHLFAKGITLKSLNFLQHYEIDENSEIKRMMNSL